MLRSPRTARASSPTAAVRRWRGRRDVVRVTGSRTRKALGSLSRRSAHHLYWLELCQLLDPFRDASRLRRTSLDHPGCVGQLVSRDLMALIVPPVGCGERRCAQPLRVAVPPADFWVSRTSKALSALTFGTHHAWVQGAATTPCLRTGRYGAERLKGGSTSGSEIAMSQSQPPHMHGALSRADLQSVAPTPGS